MNHGPSDAMQVAKRLFGRLLSLLGLFVLVGIIAGTAPAILKIAGPVLLLVAGIAVFRPLPEIGLGSRLFAFFVVLLIAGPATIIGLADVEPAEDGNSASTVASRTENGESVDAGHPATTAAAVPVERTRASVPENELRAAAGGVENRSDPDQLSPEKEASAADLPTEPLPAGPVNFKAAHWETHCDPTCRTFTISEYQISSDAPRTKLLLEVDDAQLVVSALDTEEQHRKFWTDRLRPEFERDGRRYVASKYFFNDAFKGSLAIDGEPLIELAAVDDSHLRARLVPEALDALRAGRSATLTFASLSLGAGRTKNFSLIGFTKAFAARRSTEDSTARSDAIAEPRLVIARELQGNQFDLEPDKLQEVPNPAGEGTFVFYPEIKIEGFPRRFVWFVRGTDAVALNGPSKTAAPGLPWPREVPIRFWDQTGLSSGDVSEKGLGAAFR